MFVSTSQQPTAPPSPFRPCRGCSKLMKSSGDNDRHETGMEKTCFFFFDHGQKFLFDSQWHARLSWFLRSVHVTYRFPSVLSFLSIRFFFCFSLFFLFSVKLYARCLVFLIDLIHYPWQNWNRQYKRVFSLHFPTWFLSIEKIIVQHNVFELLPTCRPS